MDFSHYTDKPAQLAAELVNTHEVFSAAEHLTTAEDLRVFLEEHAADRQHPDWQIAERDLHEVRALRARLREAFDAPDEESAVDIINGILRDAAVTPRVSLHSGVPHLHFEEQQASPADWLAAVTAMGLSVAIIDGGLDRLGVCASSTCDDVYVDVSRNRSRRHCSDTCTTRENVAAHRKRKRQDT